MMLVTASLLAALSTVGASAHRPTYPVAVDTPGVRLTRAQLEAKLAASTGDAPADLAGADLSGLDLAGLDFRRASLTHVRLADAKLAGSNLFSCDLTDA